MKHHGLTEEMKRFILRCRWIKWANRRIPRTYGELARLMHLSDRLSRWKPTWEQRCNAKSSTP